MAQQSSSLALRYSVIAVAVGGLALLFYGIANGFGQRGVTAQQFVDFQEGGNPHLGFRRAHAKGFCLAGEFVANGDLTAYSSATLFQPGSTPFVGRISVGGGNPTAPDLAAEVRSLALSIGDKPSVRWQTAMNTPPVMPVRNAHDFYAQMNAFRPDPETGRPNPERVAAFLEAHPETQAAREWQASYTATESYATETYNSINAFYLVKDGQRQAVRWAAVPHAESHGRGFEGDRDDANALQNEFMARLESAPVVFDLVFTLATAADNENDPTVRWPADRQQVVAGQIVIHSASDQSEGLCNGINFDPLVLPRGMAPTQDEILSARSSVYAESYRRRAREHFYQQAPSQPSANEQEKE